MRNNRPVPEPCLSLRQIARRLGIPPSTVTYYKDRFTNILPKPLGAGRNRRYPLEALQVFAEIRELFSLNWTAAQIEEHLGVTAEREQALAPAVTGTPPTPPDARGAPYAQDAPGAAQSRDDVLSSVLEAFAAFQDAAAKTQDVEALKRELEAARKAQERLERELAVREAVFLARIEKLAAQGKRLEERLDKRLDKAFAHKDGGRDQAGESGPSREELDLPLVILNEQGEYLGVSGGQKPFSLGEFLGIMEKGGKKHRVQGMRWSRCGAIWSLSINSVDAAAKKTHEHVLETEGLVTPLGNRVMRLVSLNIDGQATPQHLLLLLFRNIRDGFAA